MSTNNNYYSYYGAQAGGQQQQSAAQSQAPATAAGTATSASASPYAGYGSYYGAAAAAAASTPQSRAPSAPAGAAAAAAPATTTGYYGQYGGAAAPAAPAAAPAATSAAPQGYPAYPTAAPSAAPRSAGPSAASGGYYDPNATAAAPYKPATAAAAATAATAPPPVPPSPSPPSAAPTTHAASPYGGAPAPSNQATRPAPPPPAPAQPQPQHQQQQQPPYQQPSAVPPSPYGQQYSQQPPALQQPPAPQQSTWPSGAHGASNDHQPPPQQQQQPSREPARYVERPPADKGPSIDTFRLDELVRQPPKRQISLGVVPNPARDVRYTDIPQEYETRDNDPPAAVVDFVGLDNGNANPKFFRPTTGSIPADANIARDSNVVFGAVLSPLHQPLYSEEAVPLVRGGARGEPVRCQRCRAYLSCHAAFTEMGHRWTCPLCAMSNEVAAEFFVNLDAGGTRLDAPQRPELRVGTVEYDVDDLPDYALKLEDDTAIPTRPLHHLFLLCVSQAAAQTFLADYVEGVRAAVAALAESSPQCRVSFITYASQLHFYNFRHPGMPQKCVPDVDNPFVPLPFTRLCWLEAAADAALIDAFLQRVPSIAADLGERECATGAAVKAATLVLAGQHGGRVIVCASGPPSRGLGAYKLRDVMTTYGTDKEKDLLRPAASGPAETFWSATATSAAKQQISFDLFLFSRDYCDLPTLSQLCHVSNGKVFLFPHYDPLIDNTKVHASLRTLLTEEAGYAGILRVRCSPGIRVHRYHGHYLAQNPQDMDLASVSGSSTFFVEFSHEGKLATDSYAYFQTALLYTTRGGHRRVRVHSARVTVAASLTGVFGLADLEAALVGAIHYMASDAVNKGLKAARDAAVNRLLAQLTNYRRYCVSNKQPKTLLLPGRLKLFAVFLLCLLKSDAFIAGTTVTVDRRAHCISELMRLPLHKLVPFLYPSLFALRHMLTDQQCGEAHAATGQCILPRRRQLVLDNIARTGVYLACDEQARMVYLWIGDSVPVEVAQCLFGCDDARVVCRAEGYGEECFSARLTRLLQSQMFREDGMRQLVVLHMGDPGENAFFNLLMEEKRSVNESSHDEFLVMLHVTVNRNLSISEADTAATSHAAYSSYQF